MIRLKTVRGYHIGGDIRRIAGYPLQKIYTTANGPSRLADPNGSYVINQLYVQAFLLAAPLSEYPICFWHGGGMTGVAWDNTPDDRAGWHDFFMRAGYDTYVSDAVERGRAGWSRYPEINSMAPQHRTLDEAWHQFRFGPENGYSSTMVTRRCYPGLKFPTAHIHQLGKQLVARWTNSNTSTFCAYKALLADIAKPVIIIAHSQGGY